MAAFSKYLTARNSSLAGAAFLLLCLLHKRRRALGLHGKKSGKPPLQNNEKEGKKERAVVDKVFFSRLTQILKIMVPRTFCKETGYLVLIAVMLVSRTYCDVWMIQNGTLIESGIIGRSRKDFKRYLLNFIAAMPLISLVNNFLKYGLNELKLCFRVRLTKYLYEEYLQAFTYYKMGNLDNRIANPDQLLTQDVEKFCNSVVDLYSNLSKPFLDIVLYIFKLTSAIGAQGPASMMAYLVVSGLFLTRLRRPIGKMTITEQKYEGEYRYVNSRLITNSEEIAFYNGNKREKQTVHSVFRKLVEHLHNFILFRFSMGFIDSIIAKYLATVVGYLVVSRPFLDLSHPRHLKSTHSELLEDYYQSGRMLLRMSQALGRIVLAGREMTRLAGFTARITELMQVLKDLNHGKYERTMVSQQEKGIEGGQVIPLIPGAGEIIIADNIIKFDHVPLATPNGDVLIRDLNFEVRSGANVLICGPNGCGKSSLFRVLGELWPLFGGRLTKPERGKLFYVPQRPYMTLGTLRDQVIYPDGREDQKRKGISDLILKEYLDNVQLGHILEREGGWDSVQDWMDVLSGGEKQRMAMARLFYHKPQFAILDECTSAVSVDVEGYIYSHCRKVGITLFTVSHRKSLWKHHEYYLHMDGRGNYEFKQITEDTVEFGS
ncbi:ATP-binding cassette sub-family D member 3 isoform X1 [Hylobates moloch]|uniref:ATP-binding cassette sub-family D member 3 isoform X1 n=2 Tax=Hylobates moloch TaxID=81572 RepID=UPI001362D4EF|nr:ATP-binding cassette sub-family D member 3 isoform X1 [Hylobates moloch]